MNLSYKMVKFNLPLSIRSIPMEIESNKNEDCTYCGYTPEKDVVTCYKVEKTVVDPQVDIYYFLYINQK